MTSKPSENLTPKLKKRLKSDLSLYTILQILSLTLFEKTHLNQLIDSSSNKNLDATSLKQLYLFDLWPDSSDSGVFSFVSSHLSSWSQPHWTLVAQNQIYS